MVVHFFWAAVEKIRVCALFNSEKLDIFLADATRGFQIEQTDVLVVGVLTELWLVASFVVSILSALIVWFDFARPALQIFAYFLWRALIECIWEIYSFYDG